MAFFLPSSTNDSTHLVWNFLWLKCLRVGFGCRCIRFGFCSPDSFHRTTSQEQLCGFWKRVSLWDSSLQWSFWSQLHCPQTHTIKLLDARTGRSREQNQCSSSHWTSLRFPRSIWNTRHISKNRNNKIPKFQSKQPIQSQSSVRRDDLRFCWTVRNWCLFLAHPTYWNKCMTSKNVQCSSRSGFRIFKISLEVRVLKQSQSALFDSITHMTILFLFTSMMNLWCQSIQAFVTGFGPFCNRLCTDHRTSGLPIRTWYKHFRTIWKHTCDTPTNFLLLWSGGHRCRE